jgi:hypothetical protein
MPVPGVLKEDYRIKGVWSAARSAEELAYKPEPYGI